MKACVIFSTLGPNPAPLIELVWKLARSGRFDRFDIHVVVEQRGRHYLDLEVLAPGAALEQLRGLLGEDVLIADPVICEAATDSDALLDDDTDAASLRRYGETVWSAARDATLVAGERPVVFGLTAGRRRTMTALESAVFQLQARPQDLLIDVRVTDARVEGGTGFFFPEQPRRAIKAKRSADLIDARTVDVVLVEIALPRLRAFVPESALSSLEAAQKATQSTLTRAAPPRLKVDLVAGRAWADDEAIPLSAGKFAWYAYLCTARTTGDGWVAVSDLSSLRAFFERVAHCGWWAKASGIRAFALVAADMTAQDEIDAKLELSVWRSKTTKALRDFVEGRRRSMRLLIPEAQSRGIEGTKTGFQRIPLDPGFLTIVG